MTRPGFALTVLLTAMSCSLLAVRAANSQHPDGSYGGVKYSLCPLVGDELYDGGFGAHTCDMSYLPKETHRVYRSRTVPHWSLNHCSVSEWFRENPSSQPVAAKTNATSYLSGYDKTYDEAVYGKMAPPVSDDWAGWDWCGGEASEPVAVAAAPAVAASIKKPFEQEPASIEQYYAMYGGKPHTPRTYNACDDNYGYLPVNFAHQDLSAWVRKLTTFSVRANWEYLKCDAISRRDRLIHRLMVSRHWPTIVTYVRIWQQPVATAHVQQVSAAGAEKACGRLAVMTVAKSLDHAGRMLQNASRCLTQLVENPAAEVSTTSETLDQR